jgi:hypothetical protein
VTAPSSSPFIAGYADGLHDRGDQCDLYVDARSREKYSEGFRIGLEDRRAGALEPAEPLS